MAFAPAALEWTEGHPLRRYARRGTRSLTSSDLIILWTPVAPFWLLPRACCSVWGPKQKRFEAPPAPT